MITIPFAVINTSAMLEPKEIPQRRLPRYGFHGHTEKLNGRLAMLAAVSMSRQMRVFPNT